MKRSTLIIKVLLDYTYSYVKTDFAEDLVQDLLLRIWRERGYLFQERIRTKDELDKYLFNKIKGNILNFNKRTARSLPLDADNESKLESLENAVFRDDVSEQIDFGELERIYTELAGKLPVPMRFVFFLCVKKEYTLEETARAVGLPVWKTRQLLKESKSILRQKLRKHYGYDI